MADTRTITVEISTKEIIKPSSPTPPHLRSLKLSCFDQLAPDIYVCLVLFYTKIGDTRETSQRLKSSLSQVLTHFYPLAGRFKGNNFIQCNDEGVDYVEAQVNCSVFEILQRPDDHVLEKFLPIDSKVVAASGSPLLIVQANFFNSNGLAISVCFSHKIADASSFTTFINSWAASSRAEMDSSRLGSPEFALVSSLFPPVEFSIDVAMKTDLNCARRRFIFHGSKMAELKSKAASESLLQPSHVEAVTALLWKCAMAASISKNKSLKPSPLLQAMNLRKRMALPSFEDPMGNLVSSFAAQTEAGDVSLPILVNELRRKKEEFCQKLAEVRGDNPTPALFGPNKDAVDLFNRRNEINIYMSTSWCKFPLYEANFGWGKPSWVVPVPLQLIKNAILLMDTKDGKGIEAWVILNAEEMAFFEHNEDLLAFASMNPSVLD